MSNRRSAAAHRDRPEPRVSAKFRDRPEAGASTGLAGRRGRKLDGERGAAAGPARDRDRAAVRLRDQADDPQPQTEAAEMAHGKQALEAVEDAGLILDTDPRTVV